jgi:hypothetical protein
MNTVSRLLICLLLAGLLVTAPLTAPATAAESRPASPIPFPWFRLAPVGTWYITFLVEGTPPGFNLPGLITFHQDWTFTAVDGGDFGALPDLPFNQTDQQGVWRWSGGREFVATGMILSFKRGEGVDGQLDNISRTRINITFGEDLDEFTAVVSQDFWFCPDTFSCPDPYTTPPDRAFLLRDRGFRSWRGG